MEKIKSGMKLWVMKIKEMWLSMVISCGVWTILVYLWTKGVRGFLFSLLNFFTGALLSVDGENMLGGIIGRTLILMVFNTFISSLLIHKGPLKTRFAFAKADFKAGLQNLSEYVSSFSMFATKQKDIIFAGVIGLGLSIIWNAFITGNGALVNTFSCIALFIILLEQFETKSGFFVAVVNLGARKLGYRNICGDAVLAFIEAFMAGCLLMPILAFFRLSDAAYGIGIVVAIAGLVGLLWSKGMFKRFTAMFLLFLLLMPAAEIKAGGTEVPMMLKQGTFTQEDVYGDAYTITVTEVIVNGQSVSDEVIELYPGDVCSFKVRTNDPTFLQIGMYNTCSTCDVDHFYDGLIQLKETGYGSNRYANFSAEYVFENIEITDYSLTGEMSGTVTSDYILVKDEVGYYSRCTTCEEEWYNEIALEGSFITNNMTSIEPVKVQFSGVDLMLGSESMNGESFRCFDIPRTLPNLAMNMTWSEQNQNNVWNPEKYYFDISPGSILHEVFQGEEVEYYYPDMNQGGSNAGTPDYGYDKEPDYGMSEEEYAEMLERGESVPMNTAVAVVASVAAAGAVATVVAPLTSVVESAAGMKKKKGQLVVNGDVDVPTVHYENLENVMIPVNVEDGDDVVWAIAAIAITPDDEKLVKAVAVPTSTCSAEIKLEIQREPKETVTTYIEVTALGVEITGEHYFHETMVEVTIEL